MTASGRSEKLKHSPRRGRAQSFPYQSRFTGYFLLPFSIVTLIDGSCLDEYSSRERPRGRPKTPPTAQNPRQPASNLDLFLHLPLFTQPPALTEPSENVWEPPRSDPELGCSLSSLPVWCNYLITGQDNQEFGEERGHKWFLLVGKLHTHLIDCPTPQ